MSLTRSILCGFRVVLLATAITSAAAAMEVQELREAVLGTSKFGVNTAERAVAEAIRSFYSRRNFQPVWFDQSGLSPRARALLTVLSKAADHGLNPATYDARKLAEDVAQAPPGARANAELRLTRAFLAYAGDISGGVVEPRRLGGIFRDTKSPAPKKLLEDLASASDVAVYLDQLPPDTRRYLSLKEALASYRGIERSGGWPVTEKGPTLKPGMTHRRVAQVKRRLIVTGDLKHLGAAEVFDDALVAAVKRFQSRHGLNEDGAVGAQTRVEMNVPVRERIEQIVINLERRRWLAGHLGERYIYVNIADNDLKVVAKGKTIHTARVVVGKPFHETPVFSGLMTYIELNPYWNVPQSIAGRDLLPKIWKNPGFLAANDYLLLTRQGDNTSAIDPATVNWASATVSNFPYFLRQKPGPKNALGTMAFMFPNPHNVFIHDTSSKNFFNLDDRYFSNGCIRVEFPAKLALLLLGGQDGGSWNQQRIDAIVETKEPYRVNLKEPIDVHITYLTAWADSDRTVQFRKDIYQRDGRLKRAMRQLALAK